MVMTADLPYEALYAEHEPAARRLALSLVPAHAADDVVAEAFTAVLDRAGRLGPPVTFRPYLLAAVRNTARRYHDRGRRLVPVPAPEPGPAASPEHEVLAREDARLAARAFRSLPERWRLVLWATAVEETTIAALANRWGMSANAVSQLASRAREGLRQGYLTAHLGSAMAPGCRAVAPYMGAAVRGRAGKRHAAELAAHLDGCARCAQAHAGLAALNTRLGELLVPGAAGTALLSHVLPAARAARWHLHPLGAAAAVAVTATAVTAAVPFVTRSPAPPVRARPQAAAAPPAGGARVSASATPARAPAGPGRGGAAVVPSAVASVTQAVAGVTAAAGRTVTQAGQAAGQAVATTGAAAGRAVAGTASTAAGAAATAGQAAGGAVSAVSGTAGDLVQNVTGTAGGLLGGL